MDVISSKSMINLITNRVNTVHPILRQEPFLKFETLEWKRSIVSWKKTM
jgi:hypothetical protein